MTVYTLVANRPTVCSSRCCIALHTLPPDVRERSDRAFAQSTAYKAEWPGRRIALPLLSRSVEPRTCTNERALAQQHAGLMFNLMGSKSDDGMLSTTCMTCATTHLGVNSYCCCCCTSPSALILPPDVCQQIIRESPTFFFTRE